MARMTMRTREAPMEWEREQDRDLPNIFNAPPSLHSDSSSTLMPRTAALRSFSSDPGQLQRESSFTTQSNQSSFTTGWGSPSGSFRQDSEPLSEPGYTTLKHGSFESRPRSPGNTQSVPSTPLITPGASSGSTQYIIRADVRASSPVVSGGGPLVNRTTRTSSFNMDSLGEGILDQAPLQQSRDSSISRFERTSSGSHVQSDVGRSVHLEHRSNNTSSFWSDEDEAEEDQETNGAYDSDDGDHRSMSWSTQRRGQRAPQRTLQKRKSSHKSTSNRPPSQPRPQPQSQHHAQGRIWSENVDLPFILSGYVQVAMNIALVGVLIYIVASFIMTIQNDVSQRSFDIPRQWREEVENCKVLYYVQHNCTRGELLEGMRKDCDRLRACKDRPEPKIGRAAVAAETIAHIVDAFVNTISYKTMGFVIVMVFGALYFSNRAISTYRENHIMHHQHSIVTPTGPPAKTNPESRKRFESYNKTGASGSRLILGRTEEEEDDHLLESED